jgi:hypothetical protein
MPRVTLRPSVKWVVPAIVLGLLLGGLLLSGATTGTGPERLTLADAAVHPAASNPPATAPVTPPPRSESIAADEARGTRAAAADDARGVQPTAPAAPPAAREPEAVPPKTASTARMARSTRPVRYHGSLAIRSEPDGAVVSVDGRVVGSTPLVLKTVPAGSRVVRIESDGYERWSFAARVVANQVTRVVATLQRESQ